MDECPECEADMDAERPCRCEECGTFYPRLRFKRNLWDR